MRNASPELDLADASKQNVPESAMRSHRTGIDNPGRPREGLNDATIGITMNITGHTIRFRMKIIMRELDAKNSVDALVEAVRKGELEL